VFRTPQAFLENSALFFQTAFHLTERLPIMKRLTTPSAGQSVSFPDRRRVGSRFTH
jgi:hypothetical protein